MCMLHNGQLDAVANIFDCSEAREHALSMRISSLVLLEAAHTMALPEHTFQLVLSLHACIVCLPWQLESSSLREPCEQAQQGTGTSGWFVIFS